MRKVGAVLDLDGSVCRRLLTNARLTQLYLVIWTRFGSKHMLQKEDGDIMEGSLFKVVHPAATEAEITALESRFHFHMPQDIWQFYLKHNGGIFPPNTQLDPESCKLRYFYSVGQQFEKYIPTIDQLLEWQEKDDMIPMYYIPFCADEADDSYYVRVDEKGYGKIYYLVDILDNPNIDGVGLIAESFTDFLGQIEFLPHDG